MTVWLGCCILRVINQHSLAVRSSSAEQGRILCMAVDTEFSVCYWIAKKITSTGPCGCKQSATECLSGGRHQKWGIRIFNLPWHFKCVGCNRGETLHERCHRILGALSRSSMNGTKAAGDRRMQSGGGQPWFAKINTPIMLLFLDQWPLKNRRIDLMFLIPPLNPTINIIYCYLFTSTSIYASQPGRVKRWARESGHNVDSVRSDQSRICSVCDPPARINNFGSN